MLVRIYKNASCLLHFQRLDYIVNILECFVLYPKLNKTTECSEFHNCKKIILRNRRNRNKIVTIPHFNVFNNCIVNNGSKLLADKVTSFLDLLLIIIIIQKRVKNSYPGYSNNTFKKNV